MTSNRIPMTKSGFCAYGPGPAHEFCNPTTYRCTCDCHKDEDTKEKSDD